jgi:hypothetical protein
MIFPKWLKTLGTTLAMKALAYTRTDFALVRRH